MNRLRFTDLPKGVVVSASAVCIWRRWLVAELSNRAKNRSCEGLNRTIGRHESAVIGSQPYATRSIQMSLLIVFDVPADRFWRRLSIEEQSNRASRSPGRGAHAGEQELLEWPKLPQGHHGHGEQQQGWGGGHQGNKFVLDFVSKFFIYRIIELRYIETWISNFDISECKCRISIHRNLNYRTSIWRNMTSRTTICRNWNIELRFSYRKFWYTPYRNSGVRFIGIWISNFDAPEYELSHFDVAKFEIPNLDMANYEIPNFDMSKFKYRTSICRNNVLRYNSKYIEIWNIELRYVEIFNIELRFVDISHSDVWYRLRFALDPPSFAVFFSLQCWY